MLPMVSLEAHFPTSSIFPDRSRTGEECPHSDAARSSISPCPGSVATSPRTSPLAKSAKDNSPRTFTAIGLFKSRCAEGLSGYDISEFMARTHAISLWVGTRQCPLCGSEDILRSHRRGVLEWTILLLLLLRPFRCRQCSARHLAFFFRRRRRKQMQRAIAETAQE